jgi:hypothetical protein
MKLQRKEKTETIRVKIRSKTQIENLNFIGATQKEVFDTLLKMFPSNNTNNDKIVISTRYCVGGLNGTTRQFQITGYKFEEIVEEILTLFS